MQNGVILVSSDPNSEELIKLKDKAERIRHAHFMISNRYEIRGKLLHAAILIGSSGVAILTFANYETFKTLFPHLTQNIFSIIVGCIASVVFILTVIEEYIRWRDKAKEHEKAGKLLTTFIRETDGILLHAGSQLQQINHIRDKYTQLNETIPPIPDKDFIKAKQEYLMKVCISKELDKNPFLDIKKYKKSRKKNGDKNG